MSHLKSSFWRTPWGEVPLPARVGIAVVLLCFAATACALPLMAQTTEQPVRLETIVVGWAGLVALLGMAAQWGAMYVERKYNRKEIDDLKKTVERGLHAKLDTDRVAPIMRELDQTRQEIRNLNTRLDRFQRARGEE